MRVWIGWSICLVAAVHTVFGLVFLSRALALVVAGGVFNTVTLSGPEATGMAFWFFVSGFLAFMLGGVVTSFERLGVALPAPLPWSLLVLTIVGCLVMPMSAWWLLLVPAGGMFARAHGRFSAAGNGHVGRTP